MTFYPTKAMNFQFHISRNVAPRCSKGLQHVTHYGSFTLQAMDQGTDLDSDPIPVDGILDWNPSLNSSPNPVV